MFHALIAILYMKTAIRFPSLQNGCETRLDSWVPKMGEWVGLASLYVPNPIHSEICVRFPC